MNSCAKCGACSVVCPVYRVTRQESHTARGRLHLAALPDLLAHGAVYEDIFARCLLCGACSAVCPRGIDVRGEIVRAREDFPPVNGPHGFEKFLARKALSHPQVLAGLRILGRVGAGLLSRHLPEQSGLRFRLALFQGDLGRTVSTELEETSGQEWVQGGVSFFPGCTARFLFPQIVTACKATAAPFVSGLHIPDGLSCCGLAAFSAGDLKEARRCAQKNIAALESGVGPVLVSCASCYVHLRSYGELFADEPQWRIRAEALAARLVEFSCFLDQQAMPKGDAQGREKRRLRVFYHDPCHLRFGVKIVVQPRRVLARLGSVEMLELPEGPFCCGQGGLFYIAAPEVAATIRDSLAQKVLAMNPDVITTTCSGCLMQWRQALAVAGSRVRVLHLAELFAELSRGVP